MTISNIFLLGATIFAGLMSGLFYSYSCSVMPGLNRLDDFQYVSAMQAINRAIQNPVFFISFFGVLIFLPVAAYLNYAQPVTAVFWYLLAATVIYFIGSFLVSVVGNIPLNNSLDKFDLASTTKESLHAQRKIFETRWTNLNTIRTVSSLLAFILSLLACLKCYENNAAFKI